MVHKSLKSASTSIVLFLLVFISYALIYMTKNCYSAAMASIVDAGIMTKSETGLIAAVFYLVYAPFQIVGGIAADRFSPSKLILIGTLGAGIANLAIYFTDSYIAMIVIWALNAVVQFGIWPSIFRIITTQLAAEHRTRSIFFISLASTAGLVISYICAAVIDYWKYNFLFSAVVLFIVTAVFYLVYSRIEKLMTEDAAPISVPAAKSRRSGTDKLRLILGSGIPLLLIVQMILSLLNLGAKALVPVMLMESYESVTPSTANFLNIILILAGPVGSLISMIPVFRRINATACIALFITLMIPTLLVIVNVGTIPLALVVAALTLMMVFAGAGGIYFSYISREFAKYDCVATVSGMVNCMSALGIVLANYVFAKLADSCGWGFTTRCWVVITAAALLLTVIAIPIWRRFMNKSSDTQK